MALLDMKKYIALILFLCLPAQAAQEIPLSNVKQVFSDLIAIPNLFDVTSKIESRLTTAPDGKIYRWGRFIGVGGWSKWTYCFIVPAGSEADFVMVVSALVTDTAGHYSITNTVNGKWFITNIAPPMEQEAMDWCTQ